jgi:hypothetical protein
VIHFVSIGYGHVKAKNFLWLSFFFNFSRNSWNYVLQTVIGVSKIPIDFDVKNRQEIRCCKFRFDFDFMSKFGSMYSFISMKMSECTYMLFEANERLEETSWQSLHKVWLTGRRYFNLGWVKKKTYKPSSEENQKVPSHFIVN